MSREFLAAGILADRFETVFSSTFALSSGSYGALSEEDADALRAPFAELVEALNGVNGRLVPDLLQKSGSALMGAKDFRPPKKLGAVHSVFCYIVLLDDRKAFDIKTHLPNESRRTKAGMATFRLQLSASGDAETPSSLYGTQIARSYLVVSNDSNELRVVSNRLSKPQHDQTRNQIQNDWEFLSQYDLWGYRRYRHDANKDKVAAGLIGIGKSAQNLMLFVESKSNSCGLRLTTDDQHEQKPEFDLNRKIPALSMLTNRIWQTRIPLSGDYDSTERLMVVMAMFGFGIYL